MLLAGSEQRTILRVEPTKPWAEVSTMDDYSSSIYLLCLSLLSIPSLL